MTRASDEPGGGALSYRDSRLPAREYAVLRGNPKGSRYATGGAGPGWRRVGVLAPTAVLCILLLVGFFVWAYSRGSR